MAADHTDVKEQLNIQSFLQAMYKEQCDQARQHEAMRQQSTTITLALAGAIIAAATATAPHALGALKAAHLQLLFAVYALLGFFIIGLGWFGERLSLKHYERNRYHTALAGHYRIRLEAMNPGAGIGAELRKSAYAKHEAKWERDTRPRYRSIIKYRVHRAWMALHLFIMLSGALLAVCSVVVALVAGVAVTVELR